MTIRQAILHGAGDLRIEDRDLTGNEGQALVDTHITALSTGTDLGNYEGRSQELPGAPGYPRAVGYSNVGVIRATGRRVFSLRPHVSAFAAAPGDLLVPVPDAVDSEQASLAYLAQLGLAALRQARYEVGETVAVVGLGVIGLCTVAVARALGAAGVFALGNSPLRTDAARSLGAIDGQPENVDVVVLTANSWEAYRSSVEIARLGGRIAVLGFPGRGAAHPPAFNPLDPAWFYGKQLTLIGAGLSPRVDCGPAEVRFNLRRNLELVLECMAARSIDLRPIITHRLPAHRMKEAYELARVHSKELMAAVFDWRSTP
jgi:threonine dehydrogenase-like Zn-dependent dehydrogenase